MAIELLALFIPIITIVLGVAIAIVWIVTAHRQKVQRIDMRHKERMAAIEKGLELPPDPVEPETGRKPGGLRSGLAGLLVGVVLYLALRARRGRRRRAVRPDPRRDRDREPGRVRIRVETERAAAPASDAGTQPPMTIRASVPPPARGSRTSVPASPKQSRRRSATFARP